MAAFRQDNEAQFPFAKGSWVFFISTVIDDNNHKTFPVFQIRAACLPGAVGCCFMERDIPRGRGGAAGGGFTHAPRACFP